MPITITDPETETMLAELGEATGRPQEEVVTDLVRKELDRVRREADMARRLAEIDRICDRAAAKMTNRHLTPDEIIGYDENGLPT